MAAKLRKPFDREFKIKYNKYRNLLNIWIKKVKIIHYHTMISRAAKVTKGVWSKLNDVIGKKGTKDITINKLVDNNGVTINNEIEMSDVFKDYFVSIDKNVEI